MEKKISGTAADHIYIAESIGTHYEHKILITQSIESVTQHFLINLSFCY